MADINSHIEDRPFEIGVTTGPIRGSRKVHVGAKSGSGIRVAMREIQLEGGEEPVRVYDTSGPYSDENASIDIRAGLPALRREWIMARGDVEEYTPREVKPEDNGQLGPDRSGGVPAFPNVAKTRTARQTRQECQPDALRPPRHHHARNGICGGTREPGPRAREEGDGRQ